MSALQGRYKLFRARVDRFGRLLPGVEEGDPNAIHRTRVASRRLRELLPVLQLDGGTAQKLARRLRRVTRRLGEVRELDVLLSVVDELRGHDSAPYGGVLDEVSADVRRSRDQTRRRALDKGLVRELEQLRRKLRAVAASLKESGGDARSERAWRWAAQARVVRRASSLREAVGMAGSLYDPERLHEVRIALKKFRYALELSDAASGGGADADLKVLRRAQDALGRLHDLQVLIDRARRAQISNETPNLAMWREFDELLANLERSCRRLHAQYVRQRGAILAVCERHMAKPSRSALKESVAGRAG